MSGTIKNRNTELYRGKIKDGFKLRHDKMTPEEVEQIRHLRAEGMTIRQIAWLFDCSTTCIRTWLMSEEDRTKLMESQKEHNREWYKQKGLPYYRKRFERLKMLDERGGLIKDYVFKSEQFLKDREAEELAKAFMKQHEDLKYISLDDMKRIISYAYGQGNVEGFSEGFETGIHTVKVNLIKWIREQ